MSKYVNLEQWQMDSLTISKKGKNASGYDKFNNGKNDFSTQIDLRNHVKFSPLKKELVVKVPKKKRGFPTAFQLLKNMGYDRTYIQVKSEPRFINGRSIDSRVIIINKFLFDNQVKKISNEITAFWYENSTEDCMSTLFNVGKG